MSKRTDQKAIDRLFDAFAETLSQIILEGKTVIDKEGEVQKITPDAATLNVVRQFLEKNGGTVLPGTNSKVNELTKLLPFDGSEYNEDYAN